MSAEILQPDPITESRLKFLYPGIAEDFRSVDLWMWDRHGLRIRCAEGIRTAQGQEAIWAMGRSQLENGKWVIVDRRAVKTHAPPGDCLHQYGLAFDFCFLGNDPYLKKNPKCDFYFEEAAKFIVNTGMTSGAYWAPPKTDPGHAENMYGMSLGQIKALAQKGGNRLLWAEINKRLGITQQGELLHV